LKISVPAPILRSTPSARTIKQLKSRYAFVLTGTPLENKLEELYSVVEFVDGRRLGPAFRFLKEHRMEDEKGKLLGYRGLDQIHRRLEPILLRRTRQEVLQELPERTDQIFRVRMTPEQAAPYWEQSDILAGIMRKWQRQGWLSEVDLRRITCCIQNMRMLCNSTFLYDKETNISPKLEEFREIIRELAIEEKRKVVVFSEYERMTYLVSQELSKLQIGWVWLHGGRAGPKTWRTDRALLERSRLQGIPLHRRRGSGVEPAGRLGSGEFRAAVEPGTARAACGAGPSPRPNSSRAGGASATEHSIEERVWETLQLKKALFRGCLIRRPTRSVLKSSAAGA
jgi:hypothetical protein